MQQMHEAVPACTCRPKRVCSKSATLASGRPPRVRATFDDQRDHTGAELYAGKPPTRRRSAAGGDPGYAADTATQMADLDVDSGASHWTHRMGQVFLILRRRAGHVDRETPQSGHFVGTGAAKV